MNKKLWKMLPLLTGLVLLAGSTVTAHGDNDKTIDVGLFSLTLPDNWNYDPDDISDYDNASSASVFAGEDEKEAESSLTIKANEQSSYSFRSNLRSCNIDVHDYADGNVEKVTFGDVEYVRSADKYRIYYNYRH